MLNLDVSASRWPDDGLRFGRRAIGAVLAACTLVLAGVAASSATPRPSLSLKIVGPLEVGTAAVVRGHVEHAPAGSSVVLQGRWDGKWHRLRGQTPRTARYAFRFRVPPAATAIRWRLRAILVSHGKTLAASRLLYVSVKGGKRPGTFSPPTSGGALPVSTSTGATSVGGGTAGSSTAGSSQGGTQTGSGPSPGATAAGGGGSGGGSAPSSSVAYKVPASTRVYDSSAIQAVTPQAQDDAVVVTVRPPAGSPAPVVGGHAALGPTMDLPHGMFAEVKSVDSQSDGSYRLGLVTAPIDQVFDDVQYHFDGAVTPQLVDENNQPATDASTRGATVFRGSGSFRGSKADTAFECKDGSNVKKPGDLFSTKTIFPIEVKLENTKVIHNFDSGSFFPARKPRLLLQLSGEAVASVGFGAKAAFECELSDNYRANHRLVLPLRNIGPVPVAVFLEPVLKFSVSASGKVEWTQRHFYSITIEKDGFDPVTARRGHSTSPVEADLNAKLSASLFVGGNLILEVGAATKGAAAGAGVYGAFGPEFEVSTDSAQPGCVKGVARLKMELGLRLDVYKKTWTKELASLTSPDANLFKTPRCNLPDSPPRGDPYPSGGSEPDPGEGSPGGPTLYHGAIVKSFPDVLPLGFEPNIGTPPCSSGQFRFALGGDRSDGYVVGDEYQSGSSLRPVVSVPSHTSGKYRVLVSCVEGDTVIWDDDVAVEYEVRGVRRTTYAESLTSRTHPTITWRSGLASDPCPVVGDLRITSAGTSVSAVEREGDDLGGDYSYGLYAGPESFTREPSAKSSVLLDVQDPDSRLLAAQSMRVWAQCGYDDRAGNNVGDFLFSPTRIELTDS